MQLKIHPFVGGNALAELSDTMTIESIPAPFGGARAPSTEVAIMREERNVTPFGTVTSDRLICNVQRDWLTGGVQKCIPLHHVTGAKLEIKRYWRFGALFLFAALACRVLGSPGMLIAIVPLSLAVLLLWGLPSVRVSTDEGDLPTTTGPPWTRPEAEWFVAAVGQRIR